MRGCAASVHNARRRKPLPSMRSNRRAISRGIRPIWRWTTSYVLRSLLARAVAREFAWRNAKASPSPVTASTDPDASPTNAIRPRVTAGSINAASAAVCVCAQTPELPMRDCCDAVEYQYFLKALTPWFAGARQSTVSPAKICLQVKRWSCGRQF
jgi:hypothetical protein